MVSFFVVGFACLLSGLFFMALAIRSGNPQNLVFTTGELTHYKGYKEYKLKNRAVPNATEYTYSYTVNGKVYSLHGVQYTHPRNLPKRVDIIYLRGFPRCAYEGHFSGASEWILALSLIIMGVFCVVISFAVT